MSEPITDLGRFLFDKAHDALKADSAAYARGVEYAELRHRTVLRALANTYEQSLNDPKTQMPTGLHCLLAAILKDVQQAKENADNAYAERGIRKDQMERLTGGSQDQDLDVFHRKLVKGT